MTRLFFWARQFTFFKAPKRVCPGRTRGETAGKAASACLALVAVAIVSHARSLRRETIGAKRKLGCLQAGAPRLMSAYSCSRDSYEAIHQRGRGILNRCQKIYFRKVRPWQRTIVKQASSTVPSPNPSGGSVPGG